MTEQWNLECKDWESRLREGRSLIPDLPLNKTEVAKAISRFNRLKLPDVPGTPTLGDAAGDWFREIVAAIFGSIDPKTGVRRVKENLTLVPKKNSKALELSTVIATPDGFTTMRDVKVGDLVFDANGEPTRVTSKSPVLIGRPCFEVKFSTGEVVICDADHLWVTDAHKDRERQKTRKVDFRKTPQPSVKTTAEIASCLTVKSGQYTINNHRTAIAGALRLAEVNLPIPPYALGAWLGDGATNGAIITAGLAEADGLVERLVANGQPAYVRARYPEKGSTTIALVTPRSVGKPINYRFYTEAMSLGLIGTKHIPPRYLRGSIDQRLALLRGLMDTDGSISKKGQACFTTTKERLRDDIVELINSIGLKASFSEHRAKLYGRDCGPVWMIQFWPFDDIEVFSMSRKLERQRKSSAKASARSLTRQIVSVRLVPSVPVQCISVASETRQYLVTRSFIPTHNTTNAAALMLTALMMNRRPRAEFLLVGPTQATSETAFNQAVGMIQADEELEKRFHIQDHIKKITFHGKINGKACPSYLQIKTFDTRVLVGVKPIGVLIDELHELGRVAYAGRVLTQLRGGQLPFPESFLIFITTQSDEPPAGIFKSELTSARMIRDGIEPANGRLPVLYEFPESIIQSGGWKDSANWPMITPNLNLSITLDRLKTEFENESSKGEEYLRRWASQHLNLEIGLALRSDRWAGAEYWEAHGDRTLTFEQLLKRSEVITVGGDGGGLDDLFGLAAIGREKGTGRWLHWAHAWAHPIVLDRRKEVAPFLRDFERDGDLTFVEHVGDDVEEAADMVRAIDDAGLLPQERAIGVDRIGIGSLIEALARRDIVSSEDRQRIVAINQGFMLSGAIKDTERALAGGKIVHAGQSLMAWCVSNARVEPKGNAISITKQVSGSAKIDPLMATFDAAALMAMNPQAGSVYSADRGLLIVSI